LFLATLKFSCPVLPFRLLSLPKKIETIHNAVVEIAEVRTDNIIYNWNNIEKEAYKTMSSISQQLFTLVINLLVSALVVSFYKKRSFDPSLRYLTFGPRFVTGFVDSCVLWPIGFVVTVISVLHVSKETTAILVVVNALFGFLYTVYFHGKYGQTVGKMVTKVRVVDFRTEQRITYRQALLREGIPVLMSIGELVYLIYLIIHNPELEKSIKEGKSDDLFIALSLLSIIPLLWFIVEVVTMLTNEKRRALHDFIAGTVVVRTNINDQDQLSREG
jgi:uncharacterized RDD family membrane protein YckC